MRLMWTVRRSIDNSWWCMFWLTMSWRPWMCRLRKINLLLRRNRPLWAHGWRTLVIIVRLVLQVWRRYERNIGWGPALTNWTAAKRFWPGMSRARRNWNLTRRRKNSDFLWDTRFVIMSRWWIKNGGFAARTRPHTTWGGLSWVSIYLWTLFSHGMARTGMWNGNIWPTVVVPQNHFGWCRVRAVRFRWRWRWYQPIDDSGRERRWIELALCWGMVLNPMSRPIAGRHVLAKSLRGGCVLCHGWATPGKAGERDYIVQVQVCGVESRVLRLRFKAIRQEPKRLGHFAWIRSETCLPRGCRGRFNKLPSPARSLIIFVLYIKIVVKMLFLTLPTINETISTQKLFRIDSLRQVRDAPVGHVGFNFTSAQPCAVESYLEKTDSTHMLSTQMNLSTMIQKKGRRVIARLTLHFMQSTAGI